MVVGAGIVGLACAWRAAQRGLSVLVLERDEPGAGASGVAAGMLAPVTEADFGEERLLRANLESRARGRRSPPSCEELTGPRHRLPRERRAGGGRRPRRRRGAAPPARAAPLARASTREWLAPSACRREEPGLSPRVAGGILRARRRPRGPARDGGRAGGRARAAPAASCVSGVEVVGPRDERRPRDARVRTAGGRVATERVVIAAGCWSGEGLETGGPLPDVRPVKGQLLELRARAGPAGARRADRAHAALLPARARRRPRGAGRDGRGAGLRHLGHRRRRLPAARGGLGGAARRERARAGVGARRAAAGHARQRAGDRAAASPRAWCGPPATTATACCWRR